MKARILFFITEDWYFWSHRLSLARAFKKAGFEVLIASRIHKHRNLIEKEGFKLIPIRLVRKSKNIFHEFVSFLEIIKIYRKERPDMVYHVSIKPVMFGSWAAKIAGIPLIVNAVTGLGYAFTGKGIKVWLLSYTIKFIYHLIYAWKNVYAIFQNPEDMNFFINSNIIKRERTILIRGVGADTSLFVSRPERDDTPVIMLAARLLWNKGVGDFVETSKIIRGNGISFRAVLVGLPDHENPESIPEEILKGWHSDGIIEWWGFKEDMPQTLALSNIIVLPTTYGEGVPKILIEAASCGRAIIATDVPGCREIVCHNKNGFLVPPHDTLALSKAIILLLENKDLRKKMGQRGREIVMKEFSEEIINKQTIAFFDKVLSKK